METCPSMGAGVPFRWQSISAAKTGVNMPENRVVRLVSTDLRPLPPGDLSEREATVWRETVAAMPARWFDGASEPVLRCYVRAKVAGNLIWPQYLSALQDRSTPFKTLNELSQLFAHETAELRRCSAVLRMTVMA